MPLGQLIKDAFFSDPLVRLTKTTRPYFLQSRTLVSACRRLPEPHSGSGSQIKDLQELFKEVEDVLRLGTIFSREDQIERTNEKFRAADEHLRAYIAKYNVTLTLGPDTDEVKGQVIQPWKEVARKDWTAGSWIKKLKGPAGAKIESLKHIASLTLGIYLWPEIPRKQKKDQWTYASHFLDVKIEESASLDVLLHRLFVIKAILAENETGLASHFSLKQNPQFYPKFPSDIKDFKSSSSLPVSKTNRYIPIVPYIPALRAWNPVEIYNDKPLHVIVDRDTSSREVVLKNFSKTQLPQIFSNGWHLDGSGTEIAVREKGRTHNLLLWNVKNPPVASLFVDFEDDASTVTLDGVPGQAQGSSLSTKDLDKEFDPPTGSTPFQPPSSSPPGVPLAPAPPAPAPAVPLVPAPSVPPVSAPPSPASFDPHFVSTAGSMQMVDTESKVKKRGLRMRMKDKLEKYIG